MLSTFPAILPSETILGNPFPSFDGGFSPWDCHDLFPVQPNPSSIDPNQDSAHLKSTKPVVDDLDRHHVGSDTGKTVSQKNGPEDPNRNAVGSNSGSDDPKGSGRAVTVMDDRRKRRMISNRESARRSRMRKQKHLDNLRSQVNRLRVENRDYMNRLRFFTHHWQLVQSDNDRLRSESIILQQKLAEIHERLVLRQLQQFSSAWPCNTVTSFNEQILPLTTVNEQTPSLIT